MTADHIAYHAIQRPGAVAIVANGRDVSYGELARQIAAVTRALRAFGLPRGSWAAVACADRHVHWLLLLGFERLGITTASFVDQEGQGNLSWLAKTDLVLSEAPPPVAGLARHHRITEAWLQGVLALAADGDGDGTLGGPDEILRITRTSGTTGASKRIALSRRVHEIRVRQWIWFLGLTRRTRYLVTSPFTIGGIYSHATACLRVGGTVVFESRMDMAMALAAHSITHVTLFPIMLSHLLDQLPRSFVRPPDLTITSFGAPVAAALRERALRLLARDLRDMHGTNEVGFISSTNSGAPGSFAAIWPGVRIEIVDGDDAPLPFAATGRIRVKTESMVGRYLDDPEATRRMFRNGWFYPGDLGTLHGPRELEIVGREDEILNIGGIKIAPAWLEERVLKDPAVQDAGVCSLRNAAGIEEVWVGIVADSLDEAALLDRVGRAFQSFQLGTFHIRKLARVPRNANGKIERAALRSAVTA